MDKPIFKLIALKDAQTFLDELPDKVREKVLYNIRKVRYGVQDKDFLRNSMMRYGSFALYGKALPIACLLFGTTMVKHL